MLWLVFFIAGWFGTNWWPGIEKDAPKPGGGGDPWWTRWIVGIVGGIAAVVVLRLAPGFSNPMPGLVASIATGSVAAAIVRPILGLVGVRG